MVCSAYSKCNLLLKPELSLVSSLDLTTRLNEQCYDLLVICWEVVYTFEAKLSPYGYTFVNGMAAWRLLSVLT